MLSTQLWISVSRRRLSCSSHGFNSPTEISHFPAQQDWVGEEMDKQPSFSVYQLIPLQTLGIPMVIAMSGKKIVADNFLNWKNLVLSIFILDHIDTCIYHFIPFSLCQSQQGVSWCSAPLYQGDPLTYSTPPHTPACVWRCGELWPVTLVADQGRPNLESKLWLSTASTPKHPLSQHFRNSHSVETNFKNIGPFTIL